MKDVMRSIKNNTLFCSIWLILLGIAFNTRATQTQVFFLPKDKNKVTELLPVLLDEVQNELLVASYFLTDTTVINKLIELKKRGATIRVILDIESYNIQNVVQKLIAADIVPLTSVKNKMHHKFLVFDRSYVWTGSANITTTALNLGQNLENIVTIASADIAQQYCKAFCAMETEILGTYLGWLQGTCKMPRMPTTTPILPQLIQKLYTQHPQFNAMLNTHFDAQELTDKGLTPHHVQTPGTTLAVACAAPGRPETCMAAALHANTMQRTASPAQHAILRRHGIDASELTYTEAYVTIGYLLENAPMTSPHAATH